MVTVKFNQTIFGLLGYVVNIITLLWKQIKKSLST